MKRADPTKHLAGNRSQTPETIIRRLKDRQGFTLLESIATIVIAGIIAMMIIPYFNSGISESHRPALMLQDAVALERIMENMNNRYRGLLSDGTASPAQDILTLHNEIGTPGSPQNNGFGIYTVLERKFIFFNNPGGNEQDDTGCSPGVDCRVLKVSIRSNTTPGYQLTQLFTVQ